jgi:hypothetical protein
LNVARQRVVIRLCPKQRRIHWESHEKTARTFFAETRVDTSNWEADRDVEVEEFPSDEVISTGAEEGPGTSFTADDQNDEEFEDEQKRDQKRFKRALDERIAAAGQAQSSPSSSRDEDCRHTEGTSDPVERLFSFTKRVMSDSRKHMGPESLNAIACLTANKMFWAEGELMAAQVTQEIMNSEKAKKAAERAALRAQEAYRLMMEEPAELPYDDDYSA